MSDLPDPAEELPAVAGDSGVVNTGQTGPIQTGSGTQWNVGNLALGGRDAERVPPELTIDGGTLRALEPTIITGEPAGAAPGRYRWVLTLTISVVPRDSAVLDLLSRNCRVWATVADVIERLALNTDVRLKAAPQEDTQVVQATRLGVRVTAPGQIVLTALGFADGFRVLFTGYPDANIEVELQPHLFDVIRLQATLPWDNKNTQRLQSWYLKDEMEPPPPPPPPLPASAPGRGRDLPPGHRPW